MGPEPVEGHPTPGMQIWGWMTQPELEWLTAQATTMSSVVEIGCLHGRSAFALLTACPGPVYCIDPWNDEHDKCYPSFMGYCGHFANLTAIRGYSPDVASQVGEVDMTFIDGAHAYGSVLADIAAWLPKTRKLICGHDYFADPAAAGYPGVQQAVDEVFGGRVRKDDETSIWYVDLTEDRSVEPGLPTGPLMVTDEYGREATFDLAWPRP